MRAAIQLMQTPLDAKMIDSLKNSFKTYVAQRDEQALLQC